MTNSVIHVQVDEGLDAPMLGVLDIEGGGCLHLERIDPGTAQQYCAFRNFYDQYRGKKG